MILIVCTPFSLADDLIETYVGEEGQYTDLIINVESYEPTIIRSSLIEEKDTPIFAHLTGVPTHPSIGFPSIKSISVMELNQSKYIKGVKYREPQVYSWDDMGVLEVWLKKIEKEKEVPDKIDINLRAKIRYEAAVTSDVLGGEQTFPLKEQPWLTINDVLKDSKQYGIFGKKGYISLYSVSGKSATFVIRNSLGKLLGYLTVNEGQEREFPLVPGSKKPEDYVRVRANNVFEGDKTEAMLVIDGTPVLFSENKIITGLCQLTNIGGKYVVIEHPEKGQKTLYVLTEEEKKQQTTYKYKRNDVLEKDFCGQEIILDYITRNGFAEITLSSGRRETYTTTDFSLHLPIEKRGINLSPKALDKHIELAERWTKQLDKLIKNLENFVTSWEQACFGVLAFFTVWNFFFKKTAEVKVEETVVKSGEAVTKDQEARKTTIDGESAIVFPVQDIKEIDGSVGIHLKEMRDKFKHLETGKDFEVYAVHYSNRIDFYKRIGPIDIGRRDVKKDEEDWKIHTVENKGEGLNDYRLFTNTFVKSFNEALLKDRNAKEFKVKGVPYKIGEKLVHSTSKLNCNEVLTDLQCKLIFEACDPVICPTSRCDLGGLAPVENVIQSGIIASLSLCVHNFAPQKSDGVTIPFCLSGVLAGLKNIRSYVKEYKKCLEAAKIEGKTVGVCDKIRSIYMCEIIWREIITPIVNLKGGILTKIAGGVLGNKGGEYVGGGFERATKTVSWFTQDYAQTIFAAYKSKATQEVGTELCRAYVGGKFPSPGKFLTELATPEDPYQFFADFTEDPYAPTQQLSQYSVYYHIYSGKQSVKENLKYSIRLRADGLTDYVVAQGLIAPEDSKSETIDFVATSGYKEICVEINGRPYCEIGKTVSTSFGVKQLMETAMKKALAQKITNEKDCVSTSGSSLIPGQIVFNGVTIERKCGMINPGIGYDLEDQWSPIGYCDNEKIICWQRADEQRYPQIKEYVAEKSCENMGGKYCYAGTYCKKEELVEVVSDRQCCKGNCQPYLAEAQWDTDVTYALNLFVEKKYRDIAEEAVAYATGKKEVLGKALPNGEFEGSTFNEFNSLARNTDYRDAYYFLKSVVYAKYGKLDKAEQAVGNIYEIGDQSKAYSLLIKYYVARELWSKVLDTAGKVHYEDDLSHYQYEIERAKKELENRKKEEYSDFVTEALKSNRELILFGEKIYILKAVQGEYGAYYISKDCGKTFTASLIYSKTGEEVGATSTRKEEVSGFLTKEKSSYVQTFTEFLKKCE